MNNNRPITPVFTPIQRVRCDASGDAAIFASSIPYCDDLEAIKSANELVKQAIEIIKKAGVREHVPQAPSDEDINAAQASTHQAVTATCQ
ncbi:MAG: hypothetical protein K9M03_04405 [Kiritimatiellales bacterium]|nr:hypothetical protein [Kiritimatiellales bacterium]